MEILDDGSERIRNISCPCLQGVKGCEKYSLCDFPLERSFLSSRLQKNCASAGVKRNECVLRHIPTERREQEADGVERPLNIVECVLRYKEFWYRGEKDPTEEIRCAIQAYEKNIQAISKVSGLKRILESLAVVMKLLEWIIPREKRVLS